MTERAVGPKTPVHCILIEIFECTVKSTAAFRSYKISSYNLLFFLLTLRWKKLQRKLAFTCILNAIYNHQISQFLIFIMCTTLLDSQLTDESKPEILYYPRRPSEETQSTLYSGNQISPPHLLSFQEPARLT